ncbi:MAG: hypothetical protein ACK4UP_14200 [Spirosomataceae bacterium]
MLHRGRAVRYISWGEPRPKRMPLPSLMRLKTTVVSAMTEDTTSKT